MNNKGDDLLTTLPKALQAAAYFSIQELDRLYANGLDNIEIFLLASAKQHSLDTDKEILIHALHQCENEATELKAHFHQSMCSAFSPLNNQLIPTLTPTKIESRLIKPIDINVSIVLQKLLSDGKKHYSQPLDKLTLSLQQYAPQLDDDTNPFSVKVISHNIYQSLETLELEHLATQQLLYHFQQEVLFQLEKFYASISSKINTPPTLAIPSSDAPLILKKTFSLDTVAVEPCDVEPVIYALDNANIADKPQQAGFDAIALLQTGIIPSQLGAKPKAKENASSNNKTLSRAALLQWLSDHQKAYDPATDGELTAYIKQQVAFESHTQQAISLRQEDENIINLVTLIFTQLSCNLPAEFSTTWQRLKIPYSRLAFEDDLFFSDGLHPARKLLNCIIDLAVQSQNKKLVLRQLQLTVSKIVLRFHQGDALFIGLLEHWQKLSAQQQSNTTKSAVKDGNSLTQLIHDRCSPLQKELPFHQLLEQIWFKLLSDIDEDEGRQSKRWQTALKLLDKSLQFSGFYQAETLKKQTESLPKLIHLLKVLFAQHSISEMRQQIFFIQFPAIHTLLLAGDTLMSINIQSLPQATLLAAMLSPETVTSNIPKQSFEHVLANIGTQLLEEAS